MTTKDEVNQQLGTSWELPVNVQKLRTIVEEVDKCVPGERTKQLMYELVGIVLENGERLRELETRICQGNPVEENARKQDVLKVEMQKARRKH